MTVEHVQGKKVGDVMLYALSTCGWCRKTRELLQELGVDYSYEYVDLLQCPRRQEVLKTIARWNQSGSFPTIVLNNKKCIVGYNPDAIKQELAGG